MFLCIKYSKFWCVSLEHFIERKPIISEEWPDLKSFHNSSTDAGSYSISSNMHHDKNSLVCLHFACWDFCKQNSSTFCLHFCSVTNFKKMLSIFSSHNKVFCLLWKQIFPVGQDSQNQPSQQPKNPTQRYVWLVPQSVTFNIVFRCYEKKIVQKEIFDKMPFVYYLKIQKSIADNSAAWTSWRQCGQIMDL